MHTHSITMRSTMPPVSRVTISVIVHATENLERILSAIQNLAPQTELPRMDRLSATGHYGNEIQTARFQILRRLRAQDFLSTLWSRLSAFDRSAVLDQLSSNLDDSGKLHLRIDKQEAVNGRLRLGQSESIKIEISFDVTRATKARLADLISEKLNSLARPG